eukprot:gene5098-15321_t
MWFVDVVREWLYLPSVDPAQAWPFVDIHKQCFGD